MLTITRADILEKLNYTPTEAQRGILDDESRFQLVAGGYRGGKSQTAATKGVLATLEYIALYRSAAAGQVAWLVGEDYERTRAEFNYIADMLKMVYPAVWSSPRRVDPGEIRLPVAKDSDPEKAQGVFTIKTKSANDPHTLGMEAPVWIIVCEAAHVSVDVYERLVSRTSEARQRFPEFGWLHMEGTFEGSLGWYPALWTKWQTPAVQAQLNCKSFSLPSQSNTVLYPGGATDPEILQLKASMPENAFAERHMGIPVPPSGRVHAAFDSSVHVKDVRYDPDLPVYIGIDPGYSGQPSTYAVEIAQLVPIGESGFQQWRVFDEIAVNKFSQPGFTAHDVVTQAMQRPWWKNEMKHAVIDIAGRQHNATSENSNVEIWRKMSGMILFDQPVEIKGGIDRFDMCLKQDPVSGEPGIVISQRCQLLLSELGAAPHPFDGQVHVYSWHMDRDGEVSGRVPRDAYCDGIKAMTYLMVNTQGYAYDNQRRTKITVKSPRRGRSTVHDRIRRRRRETVRIG